MTDLGLHKKTRTISKRLPTNVSSSGPVAILGQMPNISGTPTEGDTNLVHRSAHKNLQTDRLIRHPAAEVLDFIKQDPSLGVYLAAGAMSGEGASYPRTSSSTSTVEHSASVTSIKFEDLPDFRQRLKKLSEEPINQVVDGEQGAKVKQPKAQHPNHRSPNLCNWHWQIPNLYTASGESVAKSIFAATLGPIPVTSQENTVILELLSVLEGLSGDLIVADPVKDPYAPRIFTISSSINVPLSQQVKSLLPIASDYSIVEHFINEMTAFDKGQVNHALSEAMSNIITEYHVQVAQWEALLKKNELTIQKLWFYSQRMLTSMKILATIAINISNSKAIGGKVLTLLHKLTASYSGDLAGHEICLYLIQSASVPYMEMLEKWVHLGTISDPYEEFLVEENNVDKYKLVFDYSVDYWEKQYTICKEMLPVFLERVSQVVLRTGKYLNVIRQCGKDVKSPLTDEIIYTVTEVQYVEAIEKAYSFASQTLLDLMLKDYDLIGRLRSVKHYFLLDQGDFIVQLMDSCEGELSKHIDDIIQTRLEPLLELALRTSGANNDPYKDDICSQLLPYNIYGQMFKIHSISTNSEEELRHPQAEKKELTGIKCFAFNYQVQWPVSLVINGQAILCYQMIFRHLFYCKHVERSLCRVWMCDKVAKTFVQATSSTYSSAFTLRQRMLNCVQNLEYFMMVEVIEPYWHAFLSTMAKVKNIDEVIECHNDFLNNCLKDCMLTSPILLHNVSELMNVCIQFCQFVQYMRKYSLDAELGNDTDDSDLSEEGPNTACDVDCGDSQTYNETVSKFDEQFSALLFRLLTRLKELGRRNNSEKLVGIMYRLDFNNFYEEKMKQMGSKLILSAGDTSG